MAIKLTLRNSQDSEPWHKNLLYQQVFNFFSNRDEIKLQSLTFGFMLVNRSQFFALGDINPPLIFRLISKMVTAFYFYFLSKGPEIVALWMSSFVFKQVMLFVIYYCINMTHRSNA